MPTEPPRPTPATGSQLDVERGLAGSSRLAGCARRERFDALYRPRTLPLQSEDGPFLTVVIRTTGRRGETLRTALMSLAGQTCDDFRVVLLVHSTDPDAVATTRSLVEEFPAAMVDRIDLVTCRRDGRAAPLNDALDHFTGAYLAVLDDDDFVFADWVEVFRDLAATDPGRVLRATCVDQTYRIDRVADRDVPRATSWFLRSWPDRFDAFAHLDRNLTPFMSVAFPRCVFTTLGLRWDETLTTTEDWQFLIHATMNCGVAESTTITCIYRRWSNGESSSSLHAAAEWSANHERIRDEIDAQPILLPPGSARRIADLLARAAEQEASGRRLPLLLRRLERSARKRLRRLFG